MATLNTLKDLLDYDASKFISAEIQLKNSLSGWTSQAGSLKLKNILHKYHEQVQHHIEKIEDFFEDENLTSMSLTNEIMKAYIDEINEKLAECNDGDLKDACILEGIQAINHFKICAYGTAAAFANTLQKEKTAAIFHDAEINEKQIDDRLSQLAEFETNPRAKDPLSLPKE